MLVVDGPHSRSHITSMALSKKKATTIALDPDDDRLLSRAARERGISRAEFVRQHLALVLEQYRRHPKPRSAGVVRSLTQRGNEAELFGAGR
jgi:Ribbon-helix-helix protein, copG family